MFVILLIHKIATAILLTMQSYCTYNYSTQINSIFAPIEKVIGLSRQRDTGKDFLRDIGGVSLEESYEDGEKVDGFYFDPELFKKKETSAYKKWRTLFKEAKNGRLSQIFDVDYQGTNLTGLLHLPDYLRASKPKDKGVLIFPARGLVYELDPQMILTFLARGYHVLVVNYRGILPKEQLKAEKDASFLYEVFQKKSHVRESDIFAYGKSFGASLAHKIAKTYKTALIIDRPLSRFTTLNKPTLLLEALGDTKAISGEKEAIKVVGSHFGIYWGDTLPTWYSDEKSQEKLDRFLKTL